MRDDGDAAAAQATTVPVAAAVDPVQAATQEQTVAVATQPAAAATTEQLSAGSQCRKCDKEPEPEYERYYYEEECDELPEVDEDSGAEECDESSKSEESESTPTPTETESSSTEEESSSSEAKECDRDGGRGYYGGRDGYYRDGGRDGYYGEERRRPRRRQQRRRPEPESEPEEDCNACGRFNYGSNGRLKLKDAIAELPSRYQSGCGNLYNDINQVQQKRSSKDEVFPDIY